MRIVTEFAPREQHNEVKKKTLERIMPYTLISLELKDIECSRNGSGYQFYTLKASQMSKVHTSSPQIPDSWDKVKIHFSD